ncbi:MAG: amino acid aminotransferase [Candidatus Dasytiphilus stammeri]
MFEAIVAAEEDAILGLNEHFSADTRSNKINLGIGVYTNENGKTPILDSVKIAEQKILETEQTKNYLRIEGMENFALYTQKLLFGNNNEILRLKNACTVQTPGGTGALRIAADFLVKINIKRIWISNPTWLNHKNIFTAAGLEVCEYYWYESANHSLDFEKVFSTLQNKVKSSEVVLFHTCCHNPTGIDPTIEQWNQLAILSAMNNWLPMFDFAYQGFDRSLEEDCQGLRFFAHHNSEIIVASSYSKNMGLYNERVGALTIKTKDSNIANIVLSQLKSIIRTHYSNPPAHGANIVTTILEDISLRSMWEKELSIMRNRIKEMRTLFVNTLSKKNIKRDFSFIQNQHGMFSYTGLLPEEIINLRKKFAVYALTSGRINIASMTSNNMDYLCTAISAVLN